MKALKFVLSGETAFFKMPEVNSICYFTYSCIHKVALLGIFGAIMGYEGYRSQGKKKYPEFYEKLSEVEISIVPASNSSIIKKMNPFVVSKKIQAFNNSVGYASQEMGGNLIVKQQWLEHPRWEIYLMLKSELEEKIADHIMNHRCIYIPYLGSNDHPATLSDCEIIDISEQHEYKGIHSLYMRKFEHFDKSVDEDDEEDEDEDRIFRYSEYLPIALTEETNQYQLESMTCTNDKTVQYQGKVYQADHRNLVFF